MGLGDGVWVVLGVRMVVGVGVGLRFGVRNVMGVVVRVVWTQFGARMGAGVVSRSSGN